MEIVFIAASRVARVRESLELASVVCWNTSNYRWIKRFLSVSLPKEATLWELTDFTEGWVALLGAHPSKAVLKDIEASYRNSETSLQQEWETHCVDHFGSLTSELFPWIPSFTSQ